MGCCCTRDNYDVEMSTMCHSKEANFLPSWEDSLINDLQCIESKQPIMRRCISLPSKRKSVFINTHEVVNSPRISCTDNDCTINIMIDKDKATDLYFDYERIRSYSI